MHILRIYVDTSVFGGIFDEEFAEASKRLLEYMRQGKFIVLLSPMTYDELEDAPKRVRRLLESLPYSSLEEIPINQDVVKLAQAYIEAGALSPNMESDALHVAAATVAKADAIISWNFKHIVNFNRILKFNGVNIINGYAQLSIHSPLEMNYDDEN